MSYGRTGPHVLIGDYSYRVNEDPGTGRVPYRRWSRGLFSGRTDITGRPGTQNLNPDVMMWLLTNFDGEGQKVLDNDDLVSARLFYSSEGLDFSTPGEFKLLTSAVLNTNAIGGGSATTIQGNSFTDVTGTSTVVNTTDRRLNTVGDIIKSTDYTPGAGTTEVAFFGYVQASADQQTTVQGSSFKIVSGEGGVQNTDFKLRGTGSRCQSPNLSLTAGLATAVEFYAFLTDAVTGKQQPTISCKIVDVTGGDLNHIAASGDISLSSTSTAVVSTLQFRPKASHTYRAVVTYVNEPNKYAGGVKVDKIVYAACHTEPTVSIDVWNATDGAKVSGTAKTLKVSGTSTAQLGAITFLAEAAHTYNFRISYDAGAYKPILDRVDYLVDTAAVPATDLDILERGQGDKCWSVATISGQVPRYREYDFTTETWTTATLTGVPTDHVAIALAHSDAWEYVLTGHTGEYQLFQFKTGSVNAYSAAVATGPLGMCISQGRIAVLGDNSNGTVLDVYAEDGSVPVTATSVNNSITTARETWAATYKQRMVGSPDGPRFFLNLGGTATIYKTDLSGTSVTTAVLGQLDSGAKATCITHASGVTFVAGQFLSETGVPGKSAVWAISPDGSMERIGFIRPDAPLSDPPCWMEVWESDLYILQGGDIFRYSLSAGGLFHEHHLEVADSTKARALAAFRAHLFAAYSGEGAWVVGSVSTYRTAGPSGSMNQFVSSVYDFGLPTTDKLLTQVELHTDELPANTEVKVEVQVDQSGTWTHLGTAMLAAGAKFTFPCSTYLDPITFNNLQVRITPLSLTGTATPTVRGCAISALPLASEEFVDLALLCTDEDAAARVDGQQLSGRRLAENLWHLRAMGELVPFVDGYSSNQPGDNDTYLVRVEDTDQQLGSSGEGTVFVRLRVVG